MSKLEESFNSTAFSKFLNSGAGRVFRLVAGAIFLVLGIIFSGTVLGIISIVWSIFPLTAGGIDVCYISGALGGPLTGKRIREKYSVKE